MTGPDAIPTSVPAQVVAWHFGSLHAYEQVLALLLAFGPFVVLAVVIALRRRADDEEGDEEGDEAGGESVGGGTVEPADRESPGPADR